MTFAQITLAGKLTDVVEMGEKQIVAVVTNQDLEVPIVAHIYGEMAVRIATASKDPNKEIFGILVGELESEDGTLVIKTRSVTPLHSPASFSNVSVVGNLGQDVALNEKGNMLRNSLAVNKKVKGEKLTTWIRFVSFGKTAELINQYASKGNQIAIHGALVSQSYTDKQGNQKTSFEVKAYSFNFITGTKSDNSGNGAQKSNYSPSTQTAVATHTINEIAF